jgi:hypothetical protein
MRVARGNNFWMQMGWMLSGQADGQEVIGRGGRGGGYT